LVTVASNRKSSKKHAISSKWGRPQTHHPGAVTGCRGGGAGGAYQMVRCHNKKMPTTYENETNPARPLGVRWFRGTSIQESFNPPFPPSQGRVYPSPTAAMGKPSIALCCIFGIALIARGWLGQP